MSDLRTELMGGRAGVPPFRMALPPGWIAEQTTPATAAETQRAVRARLAEAGSTELAASMQSAIADAFAALQQQGAFLVLRAGPDAPDWAFAPASIIATVMESSESLDDFVRFAVQTRGARPLDHDAQIMTWLEGRPTQVEGGTVATTLAIYLIPIPGTDRRKAVQFTATITHPLDVLPTDPVIATLLRLLDTHIATFAWERS